MKTIFTILMLITSSAIYAENIVMVVNHDFNHQLTKSELINIYMGRTKTLSNGAAVSPLDQDQETAEKQMFYRWLVNKDVREIKAYWSRLIFSGRAIPPTEVNNSQAVIEIVKQNPDSIGYIDKRDLTDEVKVIEYVE